MIYSLPLFRILVQNVLRQAGSACALLILVVLVAPVALHAQAPSVEREDARSVHIAIAPAYQYVDDGSVSLQSWSTYTQLTVPIRERTMMQGSIQYGYATGEALTTVQGFTDLQLRVQHMEQIQQGRLVMGLDANLPTGINKLTVDELRTTIQTSQRPYGFRVPTFGQGWSVAPSVTWATPVSGQLALGVGVGGRYEGGYQPLATSSADYVPGNEIEVQAGIDYQVGNASTIALDGTGTYITPDTEEGQTRFDAKYTLAIRAQYLWQRDGQVLRTQARYESWPESRFRPVLLTEEGADTGEEQSQQVLPSIWSSAVGYTHVLTDRVHLGLRADVQHYTSTNRFDATTVGRLYVAPRLQWKTVTVGMHAAYSLGNFTGFETGLRTALRL